MSTIQDARNAVHGLSTAISSDESFCNAFAVILAASKTAQTSQLPTLQDIIEDFVDKDPGRETLARLFTTAGLLQTDLMISIVSDRNAAIAARIQEFENLLEFLDIQIEAINDDADLLQNIATEINKATAAVKTAKTLVASLADADASKTAKVQAVITALEELGEIFAE
jgi:hypothetical protein